MKTVKKITAAILALTLLLSVLGAGLTASAAGIAAQMLNKNQRIFYNELVKRFVTEFNYGSSASFQLIGKQDFNFDESEGEVTTEELFVAMATFVSDYTASLPWVDPEGELTEEYPVPFLAAVINLKDTLPNLEDDIFMVVAMLSVKEEYNGGEADMFGYKSVTVKNASAETAETDNLAFGASVTVDSVAQTDGVDRADLAKELATDGDFNTRWQSNASPSADSPCYIYIDLGKKTKLDRLHVYWEAARANTDGYMVQVSDDKTSWTAVSEASRNRTDELKIGNSTTYFDEILFASPVNARYVRLYITAGQKGGPSVYELEAYNGEPKAAPKVLTKLELIFEGTAQRSFYKGVFAVPDLAKEKIRLKLIYSDESTEIIKDDELKKLQGFGDFNKVAVCVDEATSSISVQYKGLETKEAVTLLDSPVTEITVTQKPTGEGLRGIKVTADTEETVEVGANAEPAFSLNMMGVVLNAYEVESSYGTSLLAGLTSTNSETGETSTTVMFMGCAADMEGGEVSDFFPTGSDSTSSEENSDLPSSEEDVASSESSVSDTPSGEDSKGSSLVPILIAVAAATVIGGAVLAVIKKKK